MRVRGREAHVTRAANSIVLKDSGSAHRLNAAVPCEREAQYPARRISRHMPKLSSTVQRLILAFTTGIFLACAAHVSSQPAGLSPVSATN